MAEDVRDGVRGRPFCSDRDVCSMALSSDEPDDGYPARRVGERTRVMAKE